MTTPTNTKPKWSDVEVEETNESSAMDPEWEKQVRSEINAMTDGWLHQILGHYERSILIAAEERQKGMAFLNHVRERMFAGYVRRESDLHDKLHAQLHQQQVQIAMGLTSNGAPMHVDTTSTTVNRVNIAPHLKQHCRFFHSTQGCAKGVTCFDFHESQDTAQSREYCWHFNSRKGCPLGPMCKFRHETIVTEDGNESTVDGSQDGSQVESQEENEVDVVQPHCVAFHSYRGCQDTTCVKRHVRQITSVTTRVRCRFFNARGCENGPDCSFAHTSLSMCNKMVVGGGCRNGDQCRFRHE